jgi:hypothetical protein
LLEGSGYEFKNICTEKIAGEEIFTARLTKDKEILYTAWWYSNGTKNTDDQWTWRWDMLKGAKNYAVVNVTASSEAALKTEVEQVIGRDKLKNLFNN